jgi:mRNA interferase RelE/StbE
MAYEVLLEKQAEKDLNRLDARSLVRVTHALRGLQEEPRPSGCRKLEGTKSAWRIRVGDYRVLYEISDEVRIVRVYRVRHRREVYR